MKPARLPRNTGHGGRGAKPQNGSDRTHLSGLERRLAEISLEIRNYPTPIARCDEQLAALLEERARLIECLEKLR